MYPLIRESWRSFSGESLSSDSTLPINAGGFEQHKNGRHGDKEEVHEGRAHIEQGGKDLGDDGYKSGYL
jgi:hypothetical protein